MSISKEKFKEMLREKGLKVTNQRILVLEVLADHRDKHLTAEDIYELVREDYPYFTAYSKYNILQRSHNIDIHLFLTIHHNLDFLQQCSLHLNFGFLV